MLVIRELQVNYGSIRALEEVDLDVGDGEIAALIGANGAGKTTLLKTVAGLMKPTGGTISYDGAVVDQLSAHQRARRGLILVPEGRGVLARLSVAENLRLGADLRRNAADVEDRIGEVGKQFPRLWERRHQPAGVLSGGEQQILALARALLARPRLLLVDEPSLGLAPRWVREVYDLIAGVRGGGGTVLLVEQNARVALEVADRAYVLQTGRIVLRGPARGLSENPRVRAAYLGESSSS